MKKLLVAVCVPAMLCGCARRTQAKPTHLVQQIVLYYEGQSGCLRRYYDSQEKMQAILAYLRSAETRTLAGAEQNTCTGGTIRITLIYADNRRKVFLCKGGCYIREDTGAWKRVAPGKLAGLYQLVRMLPQDAAPQLHLRVLPRNDALRGSEEAARKKTDFSKI